MAERTYRGRHIWIDPYLSANGWNVRVEVWETEGGTIWKDQLTLPANACFATKDAAHAFAETAVKRWIDRH
jgi:spermidine/putrescine-binding protein